MHKDAIIEHLCERRSARMHSGPTVVLQHKRWVWLQAHTATYHHMHHMQTCILIYFVILNVSTNQTAWGING
jgi:hypothetical protein